MKWILLFLFLSSLSFAQNTAYRTNFEDYQTGTYNTDSSFFRRWTRMYHRATYGYDGSIYSAGYATGYGNLIRASMHVALGNYGYQWRYVNYNPLTHAVSNPLPKIKEGTYYVRFRWNWLFTGYTESNGFILRDRTTLSGSNNDMDFIIARFWTNTTTGTLFIEWYRNNVKVKGISLNVPAAVKLTDYYVRIQDTKDTVRIKVWKGTDAEPSWMLSGSHPDTSYSNTESYPQLWAESYTQGYIDSVEVVDNTYHQPPPSLKLKPTLDGKTFGSGTLQKISWSGVSLDTVKVYFRPDNTSSYILLGSVPYPDSTFNWSIPNELATTSAQVKLVSMGITEISQVFSVMPLKNITLRDIAGIGSALPDSVNITFRSAGVDSVNIYFSSDSVKWVAIRGNLRVLRTGLLDSTTYWWKPDKDRIYGKLYIKVDESADTATYFPVKTGNDIIDIGYSAPVSGGYQNVVWYSNPVIADGRLISLSVKTFHWGYYGQSVITLYTYDNISRTWQLTESENWESDPYQNNIFFADSDNVNLYYFGGESLINPGRYSYIQMALNGSGFTFRNYDRAINSAPLSATDPRTYPISDGKRGTSLEYLGRAYYLIGGKIFYSDSLKSSSVPMDTVLYADLTSTSIAGFPNIGLYAYDNRVMLTEYFQGSNTMAVNYALKALPRKHTGEYVYDVITLGTAVVARRNYFRGIYPKAKKD